MKPVWFVFQESECNITLYHWFLCKVCSDLGHHLWLVILFWNYMKRDHIGSYKFHIHKARLNLKQLNHYWISEEWKWVIERASLSQTKQVLFALQHAVFKVQEGCYKCLWPVLQKLLMPSKQSFTWKFFLFFFFFKVGNQENILITKKSKNDRLPESVLGYT